MNPGLFTQFIIRFAWTLAALTLSLLPVNAQQAVSVTINEYPVPPTLTDPGAIATGSDGALWFPQNSVGTAASYQIWRISTTGVTTSYTAPARFGLVPGITAGADGALWYTFGEIGRVTTSGAFTDYPLPTGSPTPYGITAGPDGALWFTAYNNNGGIYTGSAIGRITTTGAVSMYPLPTASAAPQAITSGPDGALWFTERFGKIGRITTSGATITEYPVPTPANLSGIATGPDGALWFADLNGKIGRITTGGVVTEYVVPTGNALSITAGPDGAMWFTAATDIGRITMSGAITEYPVPSGIGTGGIAAGPDGAIWATAGNIMLARIEQVVIVPNPVLPPALSVIKTHSGTFNQGQTNAAYTIVVSNQQAAGATSGLVTVTDILPSGLSLVSMAGIGWSCTGSSCTRSDALPGGAAYPPITVTVNVTANASSPQVNQATVTGGGSANASTSDSTTIVSHSPILSITKTHTGNFIPGQANAAYTITVSNQSGAGSTFGTVTVTDTLPSGLTLVSITGSGWSCIGNACTRSDALAGGASYPPIAVNVNVAINASSPQVNLASVSGGGNASTVGIADSTNITPLSFFAGQTALSNGVYFLQLSDGNPFGYYTYVANSFIFHFDLGYEYVFPGAGTDVYLWDYTSGHWFYTSPLFFPYLYDFTLADWLYYEPDPMNPGHYTTNPRQFASTTTHKIFTM